ncbi:hypothetical protein QTG54_000737 [Skeletonema marinoi]|uniref:Uncharacterized protein n=1 Tax=Skeletonema marinoi TaxID=267567 RepID=A0AAD9DKK1_9STRA|nr:hypothetical protein QTG54_000737 [Skeletonema marinoi]
MRVAHRNEYDEDVDVAIVLEENSAWTHTAASDFDIKNGRKVAVEFDGPHHLPLTPEFWVTRFEISFAKTQGLDCCQDTYYEFDKIPQFASMEIQRYLQRALKTHDKIEFSGVDVSEYKAMPSSRTSRFD